MEPQPVSKSSPGWGLPHVWRHTQYRISHRAGTEIQKRSHPHTVRDIDAQSDYLAKLSAITISIVRAYTQFWRSFTSPYVGQKLLHVIIFHTCSCIILVLLIDSRKRNRAAFPSCLHYRISIHQEASSFDIESSVLKPLSNLKLLIKWWKSWADPPPFTTNPS